MKTADSEVLDAHFTVDKQNVTLWPQDPPPKTCPSQVLGRLLTVRAVVVFLTLVMVTSVLLQAILYPWFMGTISDAKTNAQLLKARVDNISSLSSEIKRNGGGLVAVGIQVQMVNASLDRISSQIQRLETGLKEASAQLQVLASSWKAVDELNAQIPELKQDLDKASALKAKVRELQSGLESISKLLQQQNDILQVVSQGWKYFRGHFYYFSQIPKTWYSAQQICISRNSSHLTSVTSESEQEFLYRTAGGLPYWIGLTKAGSEGDWHWVDGTPYNKVQSEKFWIPGEPNNYGNNEHCVNIKTSALRSWNDASCDNTFLFICKRSYKPSEP